MLSLPSVLDLHCLHVWSPSSDGQCVASMHVSLSSTQAEVAGVEAVCTRIRAIMHEHGIHLTTIQTEIVPDATAALVSAPGRYRCMEPVCHDPACVTKSCCARAEDN